MKQRFKNYFAELLGTMFLVMFGCGTAMSVGISAKQSSGYILTAFAFGLTLMVLGYSICKKSGCHINPAVSFAMFLVGKLKFGDFFGYIIAQFAGAFAACGILAGLFYGHPGVYGANTYYDDNPWLSLLVEVLLTLVFVSVVIVSSFSKDYEYFAGVFSGLALTLVHIVGIQFTGTSVNPARSLAPAIFAGGEAISECWVFIAGPCIGAVLAVIVCKLLVLPPKEKKMKQVEENLPEDIQQVAESEEDIQTNDNAENIKTTNGEIIE